MKKYLLIIILAAVPGLLFAQKAEIENAIKKNRTDLRGHYIAYPKNLTPKQCRKWFSHNFREYKLVNFETKSVREFGYTQTKVSVIYFSSVKMDTFRNAKSLQERILARNKYHDYRIGNLSDEEIAALFWGGEFTKAASRKLFLNTFPEYRNNVVIKMAGLRDKHLTPEELDDYLAVYSDQQAAVQAYKAEQYRMLQFKIKFRKENPSYRIDDLDDAEVARRFWGGDLETTTERKHFLSLYPEYMNNATLRSTGLSSAYLLPSNYLIDYAGMFNDSHAVINYIKQAVSGKSDVDAAWFKALYENFKSDGNMIACVDAMINYNEDEDAVVVGKYAAYTFGDYFSKPVLTDYYASPQSFKRLLAEIAGCTPIITKRRRIGNELFPQFVVVHFDKNGYTETVKRELISHFPDQKVDIEYIYVNNR